MLSSELGIGDSTGPFARWPLSNQWKQQQQQQQVAEALQLLIDVANRLVYELAVGVARSEQASLRGPLADGRQLQQQQKLLARLAGE